MADIPGVHWIRLHYAYPTQFPMELLKVMREKENVCKYLDIALQHISTNVLSNMRRNTTKEETIELIKRLREEVPGICLRTTVMVGYPGETDEDFNELIDFVKWARFERLGAFAYSEEEGTYSAEHFKDDIPEDVKQARLSKLMRVQQRISHEIMDENIGKTLEVVIDRRENDYYIARSQYSSPEVDPEILIGAEDAQLKVGEFYNVEITDSEDFDLYAKIK
jgi:ribosomal protein S12 methylthiotransferase